MEAVSVATPPPFASTQVGTGNWLVPSLHQENTWFLFTNHGREIKIEIRVSNLKIKFIWSNLQISVHLKKKLATMLIPRAGLV